MTTRELLLSAWDWEPSVVVGCGLLVAVYLVTVRRSLTLAARTGALFIGGTALLLLALVSPIDTLGDEYLFSAHVLQHFLLALVIPPLWLLGIPSSTAQIALRNSAVARAETLLGEPLLAWPLGVGTMLAWHVPALFNAALSSDALHISQHLTFLVTGTMFWWPILCPIEEKRLSAFPAISYLFSACVCCSLLGAALAFVPTGIYPAYLNPEDPSGILRLVRTGWGLDARSDQQLGGMLMWVPGCLVYLSGILATAARWYHTAGQEVG